MSNPDNPEKCKYLFSDGKCMDKLISNDPEDDDVRCPFIKEKKKKPKGVKD